jgi:hypothetical protein
MCIIFIKHQYFQQQYIYVTNSFVVLFLTNGIRNTNRLSLKQHSMLHILYCMNVYTSVVIIKIEIT